MFNWFRDKTEDYFTPHQKDVIVAAVRQAEKQTSGEVRVFIESKCSYVNAIDRAKELFEKLDMHKTEERNAVIVYVAIKHRQLAIFGDAGIYEKVGQKFWDEQLKQMLQHFNREDFVEGIATVVNHIGQALYQHFPYQKNDVNELPDDIVFGK
jgi:5,10-methylene-tetrahydrofolate dehydrogenase/methenyl tetrahydrofolate cyclohydrolase